MNGKIIYSLFIVWYLLSANTTLAYTHADTLRGSNGRGRAWWDAQKYSLHISFDTATKSISGYNEITLSIIKKPIDSLQIDLQDPMQIDSIYLEEQYCVNPHAVEHRMITTFYTKLNYKKDGNVYWLLYDFHKWDTSESDSIQPKKIFICYHGSPRKAVNPPWDGGFSWAHDSLGNPWISVSCQELGASVWWPCKDAQWDEPDEGMDISFNVPGNLKAVSNGQLDTPIKHGNVTEWKWRVKNPINNYDATFYIGDYVHWHDTLMGEKGRLDLDFWVLRENEKKARKQFEIVKEMLHCFEYWLGPYPFYEDGYKLVEAPYLGMEHQSAIAYGNHYQMGYLGYDRSMSGYGMKFDYIIVHESGHEWFGNNITAKDIADNWIHESFTTFSESLFAECLLGKEKAQKYCRGEWHNIINNRPIIGDYGVNNEGSGDMYDKGAAILYMIRAMTNDDERFRMMLRGVNKDFYHQVVSTQQIEDYVSKHTGLDLVAFFNQYLRTKNIPELEYSITDHKLNYRFNNVVAGFTLPLTVSYGKKTISISPTSEWQTASWKGGYNVRFSDDFLMTVKK